MTQTGDTPPSYQPPVRMTTQVIPPIQKQPKAPQRARQNVFLLMLRWILALLLAVVAAASVPAFLAAKWVNDSVLDTEAFVETYSPLAKEPLFQAYLADQASAAAVAALEENLPAETASDIASGLSGVLNLLPIDPRWAGILDDFPNSLLEEAGNIVRTETLNFLRSDTFPPLWDTGLREVHKQLVGALGDPNPPVTGEDGSVFLTLELAPITDELVKTLGEQGVWWAQFIPSISGSIPIIEISNFEEVQYYYRLLEVSPDVLLATGIVALLLALAINPRRWPIVAIVGGAAAALTTMLASAIPTFGYENFRAADDQTSELVQTLWNVGTEPLLANMTTAVMIALGVGVVGMVFTIWCLLRPSSKVACI